MYSTHCTLQWLSLACYLWDGRVHCIPASVSSVGLTRQDLCCAAQCCDVDTVMCDDHCSGASRPALTAPWRTGQLSRAAAAVRYYFEAMQSCC
ncbi:hypothetical protein COO60DRAFT_1494725 [Scenedesmus sp. NREL 46B-D3]|nr:hypothetical protein COO60DRAFT_1494725 [Scenedesmus sp. NREL 46B-D3]